MVFNFFLFCLNLSVPEKLKNSILEMPIITQILNSNNLKNISATSITLHTIRKLVEYSLKKYSQKGMFILTVLVIFLSESRSILLPTQRWTPSKGVKIFLKKAKKILGICRYCLKGDWITSSVGFEWFLNLLILFNPLSTGAPEKLDFWDANNYTNFKHQ